MRKLLFLTGLLLAMGCWASPQPSTELAGRHWVPWEAARAQGDKPILLVQMLGDLDEEWC